MAAERRGLSELTRLLYPLFKYQYFEKLGNLESLYLQTHLVQVDLNLNLEWLSLR